MNTENLSTLKIHKLTQAQYDRELAAGNIKENEIYLTPDESVAVPTKVSELENDSGFITADDLPENSGDGYVLTEEDKQEIAELAAELVEVPDNDTEFEELWAAIDEINGGISEIEKLIDESGVLE